MKHRIKTWIKAKWDDWKDTTDWYEQTNWWDVISIIYPPEYRILNHHFFKWIGDIFHLPIWENWRLNPPERRIWNFSIRRASPFEDKPWTWKALRKLKWREVWERLKLQLPLEWEIEKETWTTEYFLDPIETNVDDYAFRPNWFCWGYQGPWQPYESILTIERTPPRSHFEEWAEPGYDPAAGTDEERWTFMTWEFPGMIIFWVYYCIACQFSVLAIILFTPIWLIWWFDWHYARPTQNPFMYW